ncbi:hypothetical protein [Nannocystis sp. SCPEA4]|uniref:hypothetical protein n=1 Tax=Nannocystis sp. SCPEA4 TaxID=2996787 RepID=UPI00226ED3E4|nr:hypothetical protein [Nannocystis sp. SCPEA4]MCY1061212.1 hypothetical protein [Nannocystis sp. SCPEA4]
MSSRKTTVALLALIAVGCGDNTAESATATLGTSTGTSPTSTGTTAAPTTDAPTTSTSDSGTASQTGTGTPTTSTSTSTTTGTTDPGVETTTTTTTTTSTSTSTSTSTTSETTTGQPCQDSGGGDIDFSFLWVANSSENTVSKVDTINIQEVGRYRVQPPNVPGGSPSRTSVNLAGDMAVANRCNLQEPVPMGCAGVTKIAARVEDCVDKNGDGVITTSSGTNDVKPWDQDECVLWHTPLQARSNRPVAWTAGTLDPVTCERVGVDVWTATSNDGNNGSVKVYLLNGDTGAIEQEVVVQGWQGDGYAVYGGAVDSHDDFWFVGGYSNQLGHVRRDDFSYEVIPSPGTPYGTMVDSKDRPWLLNGQLNRYDPVTQSWQTKPCPFPCTSITQDGDGNVWVGGVAFQDNPIRLIKVDPETMDTIGMITSTDIPEIGNSWGLATDVEGYLWAVEMGTRAFKIDRTDYSYQFFQNISSMYTYSDMTGFGLKNVVPM